MQAFQLHFDCEMKGDKSKGKEAVDTLEGRKEG